MVTNTYKYSNLNNIAYLQNYGSVTLPAVSPLPFFWLLNTPLSLL